MGSIRHSSKKLFLLLWFRLPVLCSGLLAVIVSTIQPVGAVAARPNILIILADDLGYGDLKAFNPDSQIVTPHLDRLAAEGTRFTDAHACGSVCVPSRYALMTGRYPFRMRSKKWREESLIDPDRLTLPGHLHKHGYQTAGIGKWHLGFEEGNHQHIAPLLHGGPVDRGFDSYFGIPGSLDQPPYYYIRNQTVVARPTNQIAGNNSVEEGWTSVQGAFWRKGGVAPGFSHERVLPDFTREATQWLNNYGRSATKQPFFLYVALSAPHTPWLPGKKFQGRSKVGLYGDFVMQVDETVGKILSTLEQQKLHQNTLVVLTSDNGPMWYPQDARRFKHHASGPYRGMKGDAWEGGHRVPLIVRWPGRVDAGRECDQLHCHADFLATCAALIEKPLPGSTAVDSRNLLPAWLGKQTAEPLRRTFVVESSARVLALRSGLWKYIPQLGSGGFTKPSKRNPKPNEPEGQLYHLGTDPGESDNLWAKRPPIVHQLKAELAQIKNRIR